MNPSVSIIILNWNGWQDTLECLESLYQIKYSNYQVILVDNHSEDQSLEKIRKYWEGQIKVESKFFNYNPGNKPIKVNEITNKEAEGILEAQNIKRVNNQKDQLVNSLTLIKNDANYGFAPGNNIAIKYSLKVHKPDYVLLLNNDTVVDPDFLNKLVQNAECDPQIGITGPLICYYDFEGRTDVIANLGGMVDLTRYPGYYDLTETNSIDDYPGDKIECDWVSGAALLLKTKKVPIKLLNEKLFFGCEDIDLALNLKEYGFKSVLVKNTHIWHKEGVSRKKRSSGGAKRALMEIRSNLTFLKAHNRYYYIYLPIYLIQIAILYFKVIIKQN
jgi:GT2 family glycosyltransferase